MRKPAPTKLNDEVPTMRRHCLQCAVSWMSQDLHCWNCGQLGEDGPLFIHYKTEIYNGVYRDGAHR